MSRPAAAPVRAPVVFGFASTRLNQWEKGFFREVAPEGYILFARNVDHPDQVRALTDSLRELDGRHQLPILIDQEGGRVARLRPPHWRNYVSAGRIAALCESLSGAAAIEAAFLHARLMAEDLSPLGITVDCAPVADLAVKGAHDIVGDRAYGHTAAGVATLCQAACRGFLEGNVLPVLKHIPGHGRAMADSHLELPLVDTAAEKLNKSDFEAFRLLKAAAPWAMTAHVSFTALDRQEIVTTSAKIIDEIIRRSIGFRGVLVSDDLSMKAMKGNLEKRAAAALAAGCDLALHCNGEPDEMQAIAKGLSPPSRHSAERLAKAWKMLSPKAINQRQARHRLEQLLSHSNL